MLILPGGVPDVSAAAAGLFFLVEPGSLKLENSEERPPCTAFAAGGGRAGPTKFWSPLYLGSSRRSAQPPARGNAHSFWRASSRSMAAKAAASAASSLAGRHSTVPSQDQVIF